MITNPLLKDNRSITDPKGYTNSVLGTIFSFFFIIGILYFAWHFIFAAYHWIAAEGDSKKITDAKNEITYAIIGLAVIFSVFAVLKVIGLALGISGLETLSLPIPTI